MPHPADLCYNPERERQFFKVLKLHKLTFAPKMPPPPTLSPQKDQQIEHLQLSYETLDPGELVDLRMVDEPLIAYLLSHQVIARPERWKATTSGWVVSEHDNPYAATPSELEIMPVGFEPEKFKAAYNGDPMRFWRFLNAWRQRAYAEPKNPSKVRLLPAVPYPPAGQSSQMG